MAMNMVELRQNKDLEFGYSISPDELSIFFLRDGNLWELLAKIPADERFRFIEDPGTFLSSLKVVRNMSGEQTVVTPRGGCIKNGEWIEALTRLMGSHTEDFLKYFFAWFFTNKPDKYEELIERFEELSTDEEKEDYCTDFVHPAFFELPRQDKGEILNGAIIDLVEDGKKTSAEIESFLESTQLISPFDEIVLRHYIKDKESAKRGAEFYTYIKVLDRDRNQIRIEQYTCAKDVPWMMSGAGVYNIGHTVNELKTAIRRSSKTTKINESMAVRMDSNMRLPFDYASFIYAWYKLVRNRKVEVREATAKAKKDEEKPVREREFAPKATDNNRRVIVVGQSLIVYTNNEDAIRSIKKRKPVWHVDSFERRECDCHYHRKDGTILVYHRGGSIVRPKKNKGTEENSPAPVTYIIK